MSTYFDRTVFIFDFIECVLLETNLGNHFQSNPSYIKLFKTVRMRMEICPFLMGVLIQFWELVWDGGSFSDGTMYDPYPPPLKVTTDSINHKKAWL